MAVEPISGNIAQHGGFRSKPSVKSCDKITWEVVSVWEILWSARLFTSKLTGNRQEFVPVRVKLWEDLWGPSSTRVVGPSEINISDGERRLIDISSVSTSGVWYWVAEIETTIGVATLRWRSQSWQWVSGSWVKWVNKSGWVTWVAGQYPRPVDPWLS